MLKTINKKILKKLFNLNYIARNNEHRSMEKEDFIKLPSKLLFVITSVIYPWNAEFDEQRYTDTLETISSIRHFCPQADILLIEGGRFFEKITTVADEVDKFIYIGNVNKIKRKVLRRNKGIGESSLIRYTYSDIKEYEFVFKISGRYKLSKGFNLNNFNGNALNFKNYYITGTNVVYGLSNYIEGSHSTRLYGVPAIYFGKWMRALLLAVPFMYLNISMEYILPMLMDECTFYYHKKIGVVGNIAGRGKIIDE